MPSHPESIHHQYPTETFVESLEKLYEDTMISKTVLVCLNDDAVAEYTEALSALNHTVVPVIARDPQKALQAFKETPNTILVVSLGRWNAMSETSFKTLLTAGWNVLASVDVPLYHMDAVYRRCLASGASTASFANCMSGANEPVHLLWFRH